MEIGLVYPQTELGGNPDAVRAIGDAAVEHGFDYVLAYDHVVGAEHADREPPLWGPYTDKDPFHDPFVLFGYLAGRHPELSFASGVVILPQRQTVLLAKQAADVDLLTGERFRLGVGVGWNYVEYQALGQDFSTRGKRADEQIEYLRRLWTEPQVSFKGRFDEVDRGTLVPRPNRSIPIWIGGFSEAAFQRGVRLGDGFMFAGDAERVFPGRERLLEIGREHDRDLSDYGFEYVKTSSREAGEGVDDAKRWRDLGGTHFSVASMNVGRDSIEAHVDFFGQFMAGMDR